MAKVVIPTIRAAVQAKLRKFDEETNSDTDPETIHYSLDNPPIHNLDFTELGLEGRRVLLPPKSPDFHRVVEHAIGNLTAAFMRRLAIDGSLKNVRQFKKVLVELFEEVVTPAGIANDARGLPDLHKVVLGRKRDGGTFGDWPPSQFR